MRRFASTLWLALASCHLNSSGWAPALQSPLTVTTGETALIVRGDHFDPGGSLYVDGTTQPFTFVSSQQINFTANALTAVSGTHELTFANTDGFVSPPARLFVKDAPFHLVSISPTQLDVGRDQTLTLTGTGFLPAMYVVWGDGTRLDTGFGSSTTLTALVPARLTGAPGNNSVQILTSGSFCNTDCNSPIVPIQIGTPSTFSMRVVSHGATDMVWDSARGLFHCANFFDSTNAFFSFDRQTGEVVASNPVTKGPQQLSLSSDDNHLYALYAAGEQVVRFDLPGLTNETMLGGPALADTVAGMPGSPLSVAISAQGKVAIYDDRTPRAQQATLTAVSLLWADDPGTLYAMDNQGYLYSMPITAGGVGPPARLGPSYSDNFLLPLRHYAGSNRFFDSRGSSIDLQGGDLRMSPVASEPSTYLATAVDGALGKLFVANYENGFHATTLRSFDLSTGALISRAVLGQFDSGYRLIRFGPRGLALATYHSVVLYEGALVQ